MKLCVKFRSARRLHFCYFRPGKLWKRFAQYPSWEFKGRLCTFKRFSPLNATQNSGIFCLTQGPFSPVTVFSVWNAVTKDHSSELGRTTHESQSFNWWLCIRAMKSPLRLRRSKVWFIGSINSSNSRISATGDLNANCRNRKLYLSEFRSNSDLLHQFVHLFFKILYRPSVLLSWSWNKLHCGGNFLHFPVQSILNFAVTFPVIVLFWLMEQRNSIVFGWNDRSL
jgi:hypothetical protein